MTPDELSRHIPPEVEEATAASLMLVDSIGVTWDRANAIARETYRYKARAALAAGLAAWPNMRTGYTGFRMDKSEQSLILPLPQEGGEDDGQPDEAQEWSDFDPDC